VQLVVCGTASGASAVPLQVVSTPGIYLQRMCAVPREGDKKMRLGGSAQGAWRDGEEAGREGGSCTETHTGLKNQEAGHCCRRTESFNESSESCNTGHLTAGNCQWHWAVVEL
jgi:hypothetical protein